MLISSSFRSFPSVLMSHKACHFHQAEVLKIKKHFLLLNLLLILLTYSINYCSWISLSRGANSTLQICHVCQSFHDNFLKLQVTWMCVPHYSVLKYIHIAGFKKRLIYYYHFVYRTNIQLKTNQTVPACSPLISCCTNQKNSHHKFGN